MVKYRAPSSCFDIQSQASVQGPSLRPAHSVEQHMASMTMGLEPLGPSAAGPSKPGPSAPREPHGKRKRSGMDFKTKERIRHAKRKEEIKEGIEALRRVRETAPTHVFVGNLHPGVDEVTLDRFFSKRCGEVTAVTIRCTHGIALTTRRPLTPLTPLDESYSKPLYATINFINPLAARRALRFDGVVLHGWHIVVCNSPIELPDVHEIVRKRMDRKLAGQNPDHSAAKDLAQQPTELIEERPRPPRAKENLILNLARNIFGGITFPKNII
ncbi:hypothetical protein JAAARDRAFT_52760 [Jaapia argillacea MUCL 33604]|uniref:RRM domain-containing protein n=1 Tax=Jaapia argillacea MUCL 33604 TaxID=933084 RepID=A0A067QF91_9AGAM|nr:hypothetical protein JAAARDRAFT_52760 [Jaapia argillacea MUCL 33604]